MFKTEGALTIPRSSSGHQLDLKELPPPLEQERAQTQAYCGTERTGISGGSKVTQEAYSRGLSDSSQRSLQIIEKLNQKIKNDGLKFANQRWSQDSKGSLAKSEVNAWRAQLPKTVAGTLPFHYSDLITLSAQKPFHYLQYPDRAMFAKTQLS